MRRSVTSTTAAIVATLSLALTACGSDEGDQAVDEEPPAAEEAPAEQRSDTQDDSDSDTDTDTDTASSDEEGAADAGAAEAPAQSDTGGAAAEVPTIVVTTNILGDVLEEVVGDAADVVTIMPVGADPHDFQASAQEVDAMMSADVLIVNGAAFEEGLLDVIENAEDEGVPTFEAISVVETIEFGEGGHDHSDEEHSDDEHSHDDHSDEEHSDEEHSDDEHSHDDHSDEEHSDDEHSDHGDDEHSDEEHSDDEHSDEEHKDDDHDGHDHSGDDPHFFTDPMRMATSVEGIVDFLQGQIDFADPAALDASADAYIAELTALDAEADGLLAAVPDEQRALVTNHEVFGYFADRYDFEVVGVVIPGGSTTDSASAGELAELVEVVRGENVPAIFSDASASDQLIQTLADEVGDVAVVELYTESLGEPGSDGDTYLGMVRSNAERIGDALS